MVRTPTGILLQQEKASFDLECPFQAARKLTLDDTKAVYRAESLSLRPGLHYYSLGVLANHPSDTTIEPEEEHLVIGFIHSGWAKICTGPKIVDKLEQKQWFLFSNQTLYIDRTCDEGFELDLFTCSRAFAQTIAALDTQANNKELHTFAEEGSELSLQCGRMNPTAFAIAQKMANSTSGGFKERLLLEANALSWIAEAFSQSIEVTRASAAAINAHDRDAIDTITKAIEEDPSREYTLDELCVIGSLNEHKLKSAFKTIHGRTAFSYLREVRMDYAAKLLREDRLSVIQVANEVGYSNASHFARAFKEHHNLLPKAYQCLHRF
ncbi:MAG: AraC family transcriptional regulator [Verrucomicrobiota bacterium]